MKRASVPLRPLLAIWLATATLATARAEHATDGTEETPADNPAWQSSGGKDPAQRVLILRPARPHAESRGQSAPATARSRGGLTTSSRSPATGPTLGSGASTGTSGFMAGLTQALQSGDPDLLQKAANALAVPLGVRPPGTPPANSLAEVKALCKQAAPNSKWLNNFLDDWESAKKRLGN